MAPDRPRLRRHDEHGFVVVFVTLCLSAFIIGCAAIGMDLARLYLEGQRTQRAADAAALAGVVWLPDNLANAKTAANQLALANGFDDASSTVTVTATTGAKATQMDVTVCSTVKNPFGAFIGYGRTTVCREAVADYSGPQPMGSPCNTLGNEPAGTAAAGPEASQLKVPTNANCSSNPQFWMHVAGPDVPKENGDQYDTRYCNSGSSSGCTGTTNDEFRPEGYFMVVHVDQAVVTAKKSVKVQLYDPEFAATGDYCENNPSNPSGTATSGDLWNKWTDDDGTTRYHVTNLGGGETPNSFCTGDVLNNSAAGATTTSYGLRAPTDTQNPVKALPVQGCTKQWPGYTDTDVTIDNLYRKTNPSTYDTPLSEAFHQWRDLCTFKPTVAGDYYLQVRTDVAMDGTINNTSVKDGAYTPATSSSSDMFTQGGDDTNVHGGGANRFAVRAFYSSGTTPAGVLSVSAFGRMPIYTNANGTNATFNLIRVLPAAQGKSMNFTFFDLGDAANPGTVTVLSPADSNLPTNPAGCSGYGYKSYSSLSSCSISGLSSGAGWNGQAETISVPIPSNYSCSSTVVGGCWFRVNINFPSGLVDDTTTWTADITGDPVRLVK